jgi:hypothetical protein
VYIYCPKEVGGHFVSSILTVLCTTVSTTDKMLN